MVNINRTYVILSLYFFLCGIEYAVILPTLNLYLLSLGAQSYFIGITMSSFSLTGLLSAPIYGRFSDITHSTKGPVCISNLFEIGGNFLYFASTTPYMILGSRLIAGFGIGSGSSIFGMVSRTTSKEERTAIFSRLMSLRQIGMVIGPAFNLLLQKVNFYLGPFHVNSLNVAGLFMATLWFIHTILMVFFYKEFYIRKKSFDSEKTNGLINDTSNEISENLQANALVKNQSLSTFFAFVKNDLLREEVVVCLTTTFVVMFVQTGVETLLTPLSRQLFDWGETLNSLFYCIAGISIIISFLFLAFLSKRVSDRLMLIVGYTILGGYYAAFLVFSFFAFQEPVGTPWVLAVFIICSIVLVLDLPFAWVPQASLYSKLTSERTQSFNQGIRLFVVGIGQILGPIWAVCFLEKLYITMAVNLFMVIFVLTLIVLSYKRLDVQSNSPQQASCDDEGASERTPLLSNKSYSAVST